MESSGLVNDSQYGFRRGRCCADGLYVLNSALETNKMAKRGTHLLFVDLKAAYDLVSRSKLIAILRTMNFPSVFINFLKNYYQGDSIISGSAGCWTKEQFQERGLRQGCNLSSVLFIIYMVSLAKRLDRTRCGVKVGRKLINHIFFADVSILKFNIFNDFSFKFND